MAEEISYIDAEERFAEKERDREEDRRRLVAGEVTHAQLKRENEIFALPPERAVLYLDAAESLY